MNNKIKDISKKIAEARDSYYNSSISLISDEEYDALVDELNSIDPNNEILSKIGSPVKVTEWKKTKHNQQMTSLNKVTSLDEFTSWHGRFNKDILYTVGHKFDGISMDLCYENGILTKAVTRGDGTDGEDIYRNIVKVESIKKNLIMPFSGNIIGEIYLTYTNFNKINEIKQKLSGKLFSNPRNAANGISKSYDGEFCEYLSFVAYNIIGKNNIKSEDDKIDTIISLGFNAIGSLIDICDFNGVVNIYNIYSDKLRAELDYDIDGLVIKINEIAIQKDLGMFNGNPLGYIAWKFPPMKKNTLVKDIEWSIGRNGRVTPVAVLNPVNLGGVTVTRVSLHNIDIFNKLSLSLDDEVEVSRRNDVIPYIEKVVKRSGNDKFKIANNCPVCGDLTEPRGEFLMCSNEMCPSIDTGTIMKWIDTLKIMNIGESTVDKLYELKIIKWPSDLYTIDIGDIEKIIGNTMAVKIYNNIHKVKKLSLPKFIDGLNIKDFGEGIAEKLVNCGYNTIEKIINIKCEDIVNIEGIKEKIATKIVDGIAKKGKLIEELLKHITIENVEANSTLLQGKMFCFTGGLSKVDNDGKPISRENAWKIVMSMGGMISKSVIKNTTHLVQSDPNSKSSKAQKALRYGVSVISEENFWKMMGE